MAVGPVPSIKTIMAEHRKLARDYKVGEYYSTNLVGHRHSSSPERTLGEAINFHKRSVKEHQGVELELVGLSDHVNSDCVRAVFRVVRNYWDKES
jgi:hypothetical protein